MRSSFKFTVCICLLVMLVLVGCNDAIEKEDDSLIEEENDIVVEEEVILGLEFDGIDDYIDLGFSPGLNTENSFTFEFSIKLLDTIEGNSVILGPAENHSGGHGFYAHSSGAIDFGIRPGERYQLAKAQFDAPKINEWYHLAGVYDAETRTAHMFVDGELIDSMELVDDTIELSTADFKINAEHLLRGSVEDIALINCVLNNIRIWNIALTQEQIQNNMFRQLEGSEDGLLGYWPLNEGEGSIVYDQTSNQNDGDIVGAQWYFDE